MYADTALEAKLITIHNKQKVEFENARTLRLLRSRAPVLAFGQKDPLIYKLIKRLSL